MIIHLDYCCQQPQATYPKPSASNTIWLPIWSCCGWGLPKP